MEPDLKFTREAASILTDAQWNAILNQLGDPGETWVRRTMSIFVDFSLPAGYVYFVRKTYNGITNQSGEIHGGIDPDGGIST